MLFAKPEGGFRWTEAPKAAQEIDAACERWPGLRTHWLAIQQRLVHTAAREGQAIPVHAGLFGIQFPATEIAPGLNLVYQLKGDTLTMHSVVISEEPRSTSEDGIG